VKPAPQLPAPALIPAVAARDGSAERFVRVIGRLREEEKQGDSRAAFALAALSVVQVTIGVVYGAHLIAKAGGGKAIVRGQWVLASHGVQ
jgi:hypothetical protein